MKKKFLTIAVTTLMANSAWAHEYKVGDLMIKHPVVRATPVNAPVSGGYMTIKNMGNKADRLVDASVQFAEKTEVHEMSMDGDIMKMRAIENGLEIPAGGKITLMPGGYHLMFLKLDKQLSEGEKYSATLTFEKAGSVEIEFNVETLATIKEEFGAKDTMEMDHSKHGNMKEDTMEKAN